MKSIDTTWLVLRDRLQHGADVIRQPGWSYSVLRLHKTTVPACLLTEHVYRAELTFYRLTKAVHVRAELLVDNMNVISGGKRHTICVAYAEDFDWTFLHDGEVELRIDPEPKGQSDWFEANFPGINDKLANRSG